MAYVCGTNAILVITTFVPVYKSHQSKNRCCPHKNMFLSLAISQVIVISQNSDSILIIFSLIYNYAYKLSCNYLCLSIYISGTNLISQHYLLSISPALDIATTNW
jgi:hypothetical protein